MLSVVRLTAALASSPSAIIVFGGLPPLVFIFHFMFLFFRVVVVVLCIVHAIAADVRSFVCSLRLSFFIRPFFSLRSIGNV